MKRLAMLGESRRRWCSSFSVRPDKEWGGLNITAPHPGAAARETPTRRMLAEASTSRACAERILGQGQTCAAPVTKLTVP
jgi:hypothetical protein